MADSRTNEEPAAIARQVHATAAKMRRRIHQRVAAALRAAGRVSGDEPTISQFMALTVIRDRGRVGMSDLARDLEITPPSASAMVDRLVDLGLVQRERSEADRRQVLVALSTRGSERISAAEQALAATLLEVMKRIGPDYVRIWADLDNHVRAALEQMEAEDAQGRAEATGAGPRDTRAQRTETR